jgi:hypothetical protein
MAKTVQDIQPGGAVVGAGTVPNRIPGDRKRTWKTITADANYPAGGYPVAPADLGFAFQIDYLTIINDGTGPAGGVGNLSWFWNRATQKLQLIVVSTGVENATADVHLSSVDIMAEGY